MKLSSSGVSWSFFLNFFKIIIIKNKVSSYVAGKLFKGFVKFERNIGIFFLDLKQFFPKAGHLYFF